MVDSHRRNPTKPVCHAVSTVEPPAVSTVWLTIIDIIGVIDCGTIYYVTIEDMQRQSWLRGHAVVKAFATSGCVVSTLVFGGTVGRYWRTPAVTFADKASGLKRCCVRQQGGARGTSRRAAMGASTSRPATFCAVIAG